MRFSVFASSSLKLLLGFWEITSYCTYILFYILFLFQKNMFLMINFYGEYIGKITKTDSLKIYTRCS